MRTRKTPALPVRLEAVRRRFQQWRRTRKIGSRIPGPLWASAVKLAEVHGIHCTAKALGLDYNVLKRRVQQQSAAQPTTASSEAAAGRATFVELATPPARGLPECVLELEDVEGTKMRIHVKGLEAADLTALSRSLWGGA